MKHHSTFCNTAPLLLYANYNTRLPTRDAHFRRFPCQNIQLSRPILLIADIGRWDGRYPGYAEIKSGNIRDCLYSEMDDSTWYVDRLGDLRCDAVHHDGTNHYLYRAYKENASEAQIDRLKEKLYSGTATRSDVTCVTKRLGDEIGRVYGWRFPSSREAMRER